MLVLSRKPTQRIVIPLGDGQAIVLTVIEFRGDKVRLGIEAPPELIVLREELLQRMEEA